MKNGSTLVLKSTVILIGLIVAVICVFFLPVGIRSELQGDFDYGWILLGLYLPAIPFFYALHQSYNLLKLIDRNNVFTKKAVQALMRIKYCGLIISILFATGQPYVFYVADRDDAPGLVLLGFVVIAASFVIGAAAGVFQKMLQNAVDIKSENDLTV